MTRYLHASSGKSTPSYLFIRIVNPLKAPFFKSFMPFTMLLSRDDNICKETCDSASFQKFARSNEGTMTTTLYLLAAFISACLTHRSSRFASRCFGKSISLSPTSFAFSGVIMLDTSFSLKPNAEIKTLSSASVALIKMRRAAFSKLVIFEIGVFFGVISMPLEEITQLHVFQLLVNSGKLKQTTSSSR